MGSILERKSYSTFQIAIEVNSLYRWTIHESVEKSIDLILRGNFNILQTRNLNRNEKLTINYQKLQKHFLTKNAYFLNREIFSIHRDWFEMSSPKNTSLMSLKDKILIIYPYSLSKNLI